MEYRDLCIEGKSVARIVKALSSDIRIQILEMLGEGDQTIQAVTARLGLSKTTVVTHLNILEQAGFISTRHVRGSVGNQKICHKEYDRLIFDFTPIKENERNEQFYEVGVDVGNYFDFEVYPPCGLATKDRLVQKWDDPSAFYCPERVEAGLLWCSFGFVEYKIPLNIPFEEAGFSHLEILVEMSAQGDVPNHRRLVLPSGIGRSRLTEGVSDVTFSINGIEIATQTIRELSRSIGGGYPRVKGTYTPGWWRGSNYGELLRIVVDGSGTSINGKRKSKATLDDILPSSLIESSIDMGRDMRSADSLRLRIGISPEARRISGFNIYGAGFGNYDHGIVARFFAKGGK